MRELMAIASSDEDDNHVISVRKYGSLQQAIKKAVEMKIGKSYLAIYVLNSLNNLFVSLYGANFIQCSICFYLKLFFFALFRSSMSYTVMKRISLVNNSGVAFN